MDPFAFMLLALATHRVTRLITTDTIFSGLREKIWNKWPPTTKFGYFFTCNWCAGLWVSAVAITCYMLVPYPTYVVSLVLAVSSVVGIISNKLD